MIEDSQGAVPVGTLFDEAVEALGACVPNPWLEAGVLLAHCTGFDRSVVLAFREREVDAARAAVFRGLIARRAAGEPLAYLTGTREFHALTLDVSSSVLVPRAETEMLVDAGLEEIGSMSSASVLDLGTGSGAIALAIKHARPEVDVTGVDREPDAVLVARGNADGLGLDVGFAVSDWFEALGDERFDLILANPPYVASGDPHFAGPLRFEPRSALDGGPDGLAAFAAILEQAHEHLAARAALIFEHGFEQREALSALAARHGYSPFLARDDMGGLPRVLGVRRSGS